MRLFTSPRRGEVKRLSTYRKMLRKPSKILPESSRELKAVEVHHLGPCRHEVGHKFLLRIGACIDFRNGAELRVRAEDQVDTGAGPFELACLAVAPLVQ